MMNEKELKAWLKDTKELLDKVQGYNMDTEELEIEIGILEAIIDG